MLFLLPTLSHAQFDLGAKLMKKETLGFASGFAGTPTKMVNKFSVFLKDGNIEAIKGNLESLQTGDQFLALFILSKIDAIGDVKFDKDLLKKMNLLKKSKATVPVTAGCTYFEDVSIADLMNPKHQMNEAAELWFKSIYKNKA
jgi:hypothetical protein